MTKAGFMLLSRPIVQMASSLISNTSSFRATNRACRFSAWARCASKRSSRDARTQYRMSGSAEEPEQKVVQGFYHPVAFPNRRLLVRNEGLCILQVNRRTWISDANHQQLAEHICDHLHSSLADDVATDEMDGRRKESRAGSGRLHSDFLMFAVQEVISTVAHKLGQRVTWTQRTASVTATLTNDY